MSARDAITSLLAQFDDTWNYKWESLMDILEGVDEAEAQWQASCYADAEEEDGWPAKGSIAWQVAHLAHCKLHYTAYLRERGANERPTPPTYEPAADFAALRARLAQTHADQRAAMTTIANNELSLPMANGMDLAEFLRMTIRHDAWHGAQIAVARRLYRAR